MKLPREDRMINAIKKFLKLNTKPSMEILISDKKIVFKFNKEIQYIEFTKVEAVNLLFSLTQKIPKLDDNEKK